MDTTVTLRPFSVLVGENSSGKTTVLQAINLSLYSFSRLKLYTTNEAGETTPRRKGVGQTQLPGFMNADFRELYYAKKSRNSGDTGNEIGAEISLTDINDNTFGMRVSSLFGGYNLTPTSKSENINNAPEIHRKEALLISGFVGLAASEEKTLSLSIRNRLRDGKASEIIRNLLLDTQATVPDNYRRLVARLERDFNFHIEDIQFDENNDITVHAFYDENVDGRLVPFDFCASGSGLMQVLQIITSIYRYCPSNSTIVLLDEPDAHLHSNMQVALFYSLREIQQELNIQIIISTHSTSIISAALPSEIIPISNERLIEPLTDIDEVSEVISERIDINELSKVKVNGVMAFFEDKDISYFLKCDQVLGLHCLVGPKTASFLTGRCKDDKVPFVIKPALLELLHKDIQIFVVRDRDGLTDDITSIVEACGNGVGISYHFLRSYEIESYLLNLDLILNTLAVKNPSKEIPARDEIKEKLTEILRDTIRLAEYKYFSVLEDNIYKLSFYKELEAYRQTNEYRKKSDSIFKQYLPLTKFSDLVIVGMGKESLSALMQWLIADKHLKISKKSLIDNISPELIPQEIKDILGAIKRAIN